jgi:hypothetical protein
VSAERRTWWGVHLGDFTDVLVTEILRDRRTCDRRICDRRSRDRGIYDSPEQRWLE